MRLAQKLGIKPGMQLLTRDAPAGYVDLLTPLPAGARIVSASMAKHTFVQLFLRNVQELEALTSGDLSVCDADGLLWIAYPKQSSAMASGLSRDLIRESLKKLGWRAVAIVAVDDTWAALRFRPLWLWEKVSFCHATRPL